MPKNYHLSTFSHDRERVLEFKLHCEERIQHFTQAGSKSSIRDWKFRLRQAEHALNLIDNPIDYTQHFNQLRSAVLTGMNGRNSTT